MKVGLSVICLLFHVLCGKSQDTESYLSLGAQAHYGFIIVHSEDVRSVKDSYPYGVSLDLIKTKSSPQLWNQCRCFPSVGVSLTYWDFDHPEVLGYAISTLFFLEPEFGVWRNFHFSFRAGFGISYLSNPYDALSNPDNLSYSTHFAFPLQASFYLNYRIKQQWKLRLGVDYNHISNGGLKEPNKGINYPTGSLGVSYFLRSGLPQQNPYSELENDFKLKNRIEVYSFVTRKQIETDNQGLLWGAGSSAYWPVSRINALGGQLEITNNLAGQQRNENNGVSSDAWQIGVAITNDFPLGRFHFSQSFGYYLLKILDEDYDFYQRYVLTYAIRDKLLIGTGLRAHGHIADFLEFRLGWQW